MRVTDHLYMLSGAPYGQIGNVYAIVAQEKLVLIDSGRGNEALEVILENLSYHNLKKFPVSHVLLTHMHDDHVGNAWYFRQCGAEIWCSKPDAVGVEQGGVRANDLGLHPFRTCQIDRKLIDDEMLRLNGLEIQVMYVPGHTNGSVFYMFTLDRKRMVASGDMVLPKPNAFDNGFDAQLGWPGSYEYDKQKYLKSLEKAIRIETDILLAGHGVPVMQNGHQIIRLAYKIALQTLR